MKAGEGLWTSAAHPLSIFGNMLLVRLPSAAIGEACDIHAGLEGPRIGLGTVRAIRDGVCTLDAVTDQPLTSRCVVARTGQPLSIPVSDALLGSVVDWAGRPVSRFAETASSSSSPAVAVPVGGRKRTFLERLPVEHPLPTGVRGLDAFTTCGVGQRIGVFAPAGTGKTTLCSMLLGGAEADVKVIALIGERTREVSDFVHRIGQEEDAGRIVVVQATSDMPASARLYAGMVAMAISEYFSERGRSVLLVLDSVTRYARALRELALAAGELPARRGYPASVFEALPRLFERAGRATSGSITAFFTVLLEDEEDPDPIAEEVKSLLDGHILLSRRLAQRGVFPAIDPLKSLSRCANEVLLPQQRQLAAQAREAFSLLEESQLLRDVGEYRPGSNPAWDRAIAAEGALMAFLAQPTGEYLPFERVWEELDALRLA